MAKNPFKSTPTSFGKTQSKESQDLHNRDDLDSDAQAHHHTLGNKPTQAAAGNHEHTSYWETGDVKTTYVPPDNVHWYELNGQASPTQGLIDLFGANLPDMRDRFIVGVSGTKLLNTTGGSATSTIGEANLPPHDHAIDHDHAQFDTTSTGGHNHEYNWRENASGGGPQANIMAAGGVDGTVVNRESADATGSDHVHPINVPAYVGTSGDGGFANTPLDVTNPWGAMYMVVRA